MTGRERTMPIIEAVWGNGRWAIALPGNVTKTATTRTGVERIIRREASGSAIRFVVPDAPRYRHDHVVGGVAQGLPSGFAWPEEKPHDHPAADHFHGDFDDRTAP